MAAAELATPPPSPPQPSAPPPPKPRARVSLERATAILACVGAHAMLRWHYAEHCQNSVLALLGLEGLVGASASCALVERALRVLPLVAAIQIPWVVRVE